MSSKYLGVTDAAIKLGCSASRVRQLEGEGLLPAEKLPSGQRIFRAEEVKRLAAERERQKREGRSVRAAKL